ncbi:hypothetical protein EROM_080940 [Encephalitozoon romaleae SJ-2008]|uniref:Uncharacterized protein n=1 Tax=Encephalitozoon romaleae (strain SJ-2008) TaxID=1178016 RepID=I7AFK2_ENCRO|nr:hypothetical protein EROM_080940 [Encephalitozoon romaleae SJ-2008]AFN83510.1 hypothetical protein EROM_080940 [Encephalitozoon romaleae SJ-2008]
MKPSTSSKTMQSTFQYITKTSLQNGIIRQREESLNMRCERPDETGFDRPGNKENYNPHIKEFTPTKTKQKKRYTALKEITERSKRPAQEASRASQEDETEMDLLFSSFPRSPFKSKNIREL